MHCAHHRSRRAAGPVVRKLTLAGVAGTLALASAAPATFVGLGATKRSVMTTGGTPLDVFELYATFDSPLDAAISVGGTPLHPQILNSGGGGFFQQTIFGAHQNLANSLASVGGIPNLEYDSFLTIGAPGLHRLADASDAPVLQRRGVQRGRRGGLRCRDRDNDEWWLVRRSRGPGYIWGAISAAAAARGDDHGSARCHSRRDPRPVHGRWRGLVRG